MNKNRTAAFVFSFSLLLIFSTLPAHGEITLQGELKTSLSVASRNCKVEYGSIVCTDVPEEEKETIPYFFESLLDLQASGVFGTGGRFRSISEFYHPYAPYSGLTFQAFTYRTLVGEIASIEGEVIFSPNIILYTTPDKRTEWYGETFPAITFRRHKSSLEFSLVGLTATFSAILDNWQEEPESRMDTQSGFIFNLAGETPEEIRLSTEARIGAKEGVTCFGNCIGPLKLQQLAVQEDIEFEEFLFSADNFPLEEVDLRLTGKLSSARGFENITIRGSRTWDYGKTDLTLSSNLIVTPASFLPFVGTSLRWSVDPFVLSIYLDDTFQLGNATQSLQFNPDMSESSIEGLNFRSQTLISEQLNVNLTVPTDPVDFSAGLRWRYYGGEYVLDSGLLTAQLDASPMSFRGILGFREGSRIVKIESSLSF